MAKKVAKKLPQARVWGIHNLIQIWYTTIENEGDNDEG